MAAPSLQLNRAADSGLQLDRFLYPDRQPIWAGRVPERGSLTLVGHPGSGADDAVRRLAEAERPGRAGFWLDARLYGDRDAFLDALAEKLLEHLLGAGAPERWRAGELPGSDVLAALGARRAAQVGRLLRGGREERLSVAELLAPADGVTVGITWAHLLTERSMGRLLWELRASVAGDDRNATLALSTFPATRALLLGPDAPLFGVGSQLEVTDPTTSRWRELVRLHQLPVNDEDLMWLLLRTDGQAHSTAQVLWLTRTAEPGSRWMARTTWEQLSTTSRARAADQLALLHATAAHAPALLAAIAIGRGPYSALRHYASPKQINRSLDQLAYHGLIYQPQPRTWLLAEPLLRDAYAEWYVAA